MNQQSLNMSHRIYPFRTICSFVFVLLLMPIGHAVMILMEHFLSVTALHYCAFALGAIGLLMTITAIVFKSDTVQTLLGLIGGLLFWTGWVEFLFSYYAWRYGVHCDLIVDGIVTTTSQYVDGIATSHQFLINGQSLEDYPVESIRQLRGSRPEYLILPATFGMWVMFMMIYTLCTRTGCRFFGWLQKRLHVSNHVEIKPMAHTPAIVTFMELNLMLWTLYLVLMFCYDPVFLGSDNLFTFIIGFGCLIGSIFMIRSQLRIREWGPNIRMSIASVIIFWTFVEIVARNGLLSEIWLRPIDHLPEMAVMGVSTIMLFIFIFISTRRRKLLS